MDVDYVVVYRFADLGQSEAVERYRRLIQALAAVGFATEVRNGDNHSLLIFARMASKEHLYGEVYRSRCVCHDLKTRAVTERNTRVRDWLHGVRTAAPDRETKDALDADPMYPAERLRILYQLINNPTNEGGAGITPKQGEWESVESIFALHDHEVNRQWISKWGSTPILKPEDIDDIRNRLGEKVRRSPLCDMILCLPLRSPSTSPLRKHTSWL